MPEVERTIVYEAPWMKASAEHEGAGLEMVERLRAEGFDAAAIFTVYSQSSLPAALLCHMARIPLRLAHCRENPYGLLTDWVREPEPEQTVRHEVQRQLDLVGEVGAATERPELSLSVPAPARQRALDALREAGHDPDEPWFLVHPGASASSRRYPHHAEAARQVAERSGRRVALTGDPAERESVEALAAELGALAVSLAGRLSFAELAGLIDAAPLVVTNNSGPAHVAAATVTPVVVLYALTNPQHSPWRARSKVLFRDVPCRWCYRSVCPEGHHLCLAGVSPADVSAAALELLGEPFGDPVIGEDGGSQLLEEVIRHEPTVHR